MPGAPNRPPEKAPEAPVAPPVPETPQQKALRRLVPSRVALLLDLWKGAPSPEVMGPFEKAEAFYAASDFGNATGELERLSIRFAEPRWPSLPEPFRLLRVPIPAPMPPHWDPEHALPAPEREARRARRTAEEQVALATGCLAWAGGHGVETADLVPLLAEARSSLESAGLTPLFYERLDAVWTALHDRLPRPKSTTPRPAATPSSPAPPTEEASP
jgi:hypothetical protein